MKPDPELLPYYDVSSAVLDVICRSLHAIYKSRFSAGSEGALLAELRALAATLDREKWAARDKNPHITDRLADEAGGEIRRISRLCLEAVEHAYKPALDSEYLPPKAVLAPSPLAIFVEVLTTPKHPESSAYGFALARALLVSGLGVDLPMRGDPGGDAAMKLSDVIDSLESFRTYVSHRDNIHYPTKSRTRLFLAHFLALCGSVVFRFGTAGKHRESPAEAQGDCLAFLSNRENLFNEGAVRSLEFRLAPELTDLPPTQEILNLLLGDPIPLSGCAAVFAGGLQRSGSRSLVMSVSGPPGTGKTSLALALAASVAPFGTQCLYCTLEEDGPTLMRRAHSVVPSFFRRSTLLTSDDPSDWLTVVEVDASALGNVESFVSNYVVPIREHLPALTSSSDNAGGTGLSPAPILVVIDSLTAVLSGPRRNARRVVEVFKLVRELRDLGCVVVLLSAEGIPHDSRLEYLVDTVVTLRLRGVNDVRTDAVRLFRLTKTRLQLSRPGAHILRLGGDGVVGVWPQLPSQLELHSAHRTHLPERGVVFDTLRPNSSVSGTGRLVNVHPRSRFLIHGRGSGGKAALAMRLLTAPRVATEDNSPRPLPAHRQPKILIISFLHPAEYYYGVHKRVRLLDRGATKRADNLAIQQSRVEVMALTPSFIGPEEFIGRVLRTLDEGQLDGAPYTGVLLDGLHNSFLQFPALQGNDMVWAALYSLLSRYELTLATTFTRFPGSGAVGPGSRASDEVIMLQGQLPFLHALQQGADVVLRVDPVGRPARDDEYRITAETAIGQPIPPRSLRWNRASYTFDGWADADPMFAFGEA